MSSPSAEFSLALRVELDRRPGMLGELATAIGDAGGSMGTIETIELGDVKAVGEITVDAVDREHGEAIVAAVEGIDGAELIETTDRTFELHRGGKLFTGLKTGIRTRDDLSMAYTPGVARVCQAIEADRERVFDFTIKHNTVAVVSDGTAVLGLGDIGPEAALPVMEGKAVLFKEFGDVDAFPICLDTKDPDEIVQAVRLMAPVFGGINLEDISSPRCFEVESRLIEELDIPVFPDDQHRTAIVVLAGADVFIGLSGPGIIDADDLQRMNPDPFVFAMANPNPEVSPETAERYAGVMATGRSDYPNQINNVLAFPGVFRGALDVRASQITEEMKVAAAHGIASVVREDELSEDYIIPTVFNREVSHAVAEAVSREAMQSGVGRGPRALTRIAY